MMVSDGMGDDVDLKVQLGSTWRRNVKQLSRLRLKLRRSIRKGEHDRIVRELHDNILQGSSSRQ